jgi:hypothetical protein
VHDVAPMCNNLSRKSMLSPMIEIGTFGLQDQRSTTELQEPRKRLHLMIFGHTNQVCPCCAPRQAGHQRHHMFSVFCSLTRLSWRETCDFFNASSLRSKLECKGFVPHLCYSHLLFCRCFQRFDRENWSQAGPMGTLKAGERHASQ